MAFALTQKGQVTIPRAIRAHLGAKTGDRLFFRILDNGAVVVEKAQDRSHFADFADTVDLGMTTEAFMERLRGDPAEDPA